MSLIKPSHAQAFLNQYKQAFLNQYKRRLAEIAGNPLKGNDEYVLPERICQFWRN